MEDKITVVLVEPGKEARVTKLGRTLKTYQDTVGGLIQTIYPFGTRDICLVCNDEGKLLGMPFNRTIFAYTGEESDDVAPDIQEIIAGTFFLCNGSGTYFESLTDEQIEMCMKHYRYPEIFLKRNGTLLIVRCEVKEQKP